MFLKSKLFQIISIFTLVLGLAVFAFADTIRLKDGSVIKGKIVSFDGGQFVILIGDSGTRQKLMKFYATEIESIKFDSQIDDSNANLDMADDDLNTSPDTTNQDTFRRKPPNYTKTSDGNNTIITPGGSNKSAENTSSAVDMDNSNTTTMTTNTSAGIDAEPIQVKAKVLADNTANGWTNAGWVVRKGQRIRIIGDGKISLGNGRYSTPSGISTLPDSQKLIKDKPTGGLIAVIGDDNNKFMFIGSETEFVADRDGALFLGVNEGMLDDNSGSYDVTVEIDLK